MPPKACWSVVQRHQRVKREKSQEGVKASVLLKAALGTVTKKEPLSTKSVGSVCESAIGSATCLSPIIWKRNIRDPNVLEGWRLSR